MAVATAGAKTIASTGDLTNIATLVPYTRRTTDNSQDTPTPGAIVEDWSEARTEAGDPPGKGQAVGIDSAGNVYAGGYYTRAGTGRDMMLLAVAGEWYRTGAERHVAAVGVRSPRADRAEQGDVVDEVLTLAMRPFLSRCAEVLQQRADLATWTHAHCALCGGEADLAVITPSAERHLICGRCTLRWKFEPLTYPYCRNSDRSRITSFATPDGQYRVYACDVCHRYLKAYDGRRATRPVMPMVDSVATLPLDAAAMQRGYTS